MTAGPSNELHARPLLPQGVAIKRSSTTLLLLLALLGAGVSFADAGNQPPQNPASTPAPAPPPSEISTPAERAPAAPVPAAQTAGDSGPTQAAGETAAPAAAASQPAAGEAAAAAPGASAPAIPDAATVAPAMGSAVPAAAVVQEAAAAPSDDPLFPHVAILKPEVAFWTRVFSEYSENQSVVHSMDDVRKVYTTLDFRGQAETLSKAALGALRAREERRALQQIDTLLEQVDALQATPQKMNAEQRRIYQMYADSRDPHRFRDAVGSFRVQRGLRERTAHALTVSGRYLPQMEQIFSSYGLPTRLTRLPLVESSFNLEAYSKVGAAGLWQFIPASARIYMHLDELADDRRDPWFSTDAAARHLRDDYAVLQNWPLAVTAYNYGRGGLVHALEQTDGHTLADLLVRFNGNRFGFASRNFYAEFLAASDVEREWKKHFGAIERLPPLQFETVETRDYVPFDTLRRLSGADEDLFHLLNPAYSEDVLSGHLYVPPGQLIRVPAGTAERFQAAYAALGPDQRFEHQRMYFLAHRLVRGDSIGRLAQRYGVSSRAILAANGLSAGARVHAGQTLKIPPREAPVQVASAVPRAIKTSARAAAPALTAEGSSGLRLHKVRSGQTLGEIARRYQTSVQRLCELNGLGKSDLLRVGSTLKVP
ncbi:MAG: LysM peptidoglycan-binding domain-containing protein [Nevskia sp.]|nr:LysM peptidoglycan-binding domain-containing protein [Nevskia sp.]